MRVFGACLALSICLCAGIAGTAAAAPFTAGDFVVVRVGDGVSNHTNLGDPVFLDEYSPAGTLVQSVAMPTTASGSQKQLILEFTGISTIAGSEGLMTRSANNQYLTLSGYGRDVGGAGGPSGTDPAVVPRVIGRIAYDGTIDTSTGMTDFGPSTGAYVRGVATDDGSAYYAAGAMISGGTTNPAIRYAVQGSSTSTALSTTVQTVNGLRSPKIFSGQLYISSTNTSPSMKLGTIGTGLPTTAGQTTAQLSSVVDAATTSPSDYVFFDLNGAVPGNDTLYVADEQSTSSGTDGVIRKFSFDGTTWSAQGTATAVDVRGLTGTVSGGTVTLFGSTGGTVAAAGHTSAIYKLVDSSGSAGTIPASATTLLSLPSTSNTSLRGIALAPEAPPTLSRAPSTLPFGNQDIGAGPTSAQEATITNSASQTVTLSSVTLAGAGAAHFERLTGAGTDCAASTVLTAGQTCKVRMRFDPSTTGAKSATVTVSSNAPDVTVDVTGTGTQTSLSRSPATLDFGFQDIDDGPTPGQASTITNNGTEAVTLTALTLGGTDAADFARLTGQGTDCGVGTVLTAGQTCKVRAEFDPETVGDKDASLTVSSNAPDVVVTLAGSGTQTELSRAPGLLPFGSQDIGAGPTAAQTSTITNTGTAAVTVDSVALAGADASEFELLAGGASDCATGTDLDAGDTCDVRARFDPTTTGPKAASVTVMSSAGPLSVSLSGTGTKTEVTTGPDSLSFGSREVAAGPTASQTSTLTNTGTEPVTLSDIALGGAGAGEFERLTGQAGDCGAGTALTAGQTCTLRVRFDPSSVGAKAATVTVSSDAPDATVSLAGTGTHTELSAGPGTLAFGLQDADAGATAAQTSTITNSGAAAVTLTAITVGGVDSGQFARQTGQVDDCAAGTLLAAGQTCKVRVTFDPTAAGAKAAQLTVASNAPDVTVALTGTGTKTAISRSPGLLTFGARDISAGPTAVQEATITNSGSEPVTLSGIAFGGAAGDQFDQLTGDGADCVAGRALAAGETCKLRLRFNPTTNGSKSGTVTITSNAPAVTVSLSGTGTGAQTALTAKPASLDFGSRDVAAGASAAQESTVTNSGNQTVTLTSVALGGDDAGQFGHLTGEGTDCAAGKVLAPAATCKVRARFDPTSAGAKEAAITVSSNAPAVAVALAGDATSKTTPGDPATTPAALVSTKTLTLGRDGKLRVKVTCSGKLRCSGSITIRTAKKVRVGRRRVALKLATARVSLAAGKSRTLVLRVSKKTRKIIAALGKVKVVVTVKLLRTGTGKPVERTFTFLVKGKR